MPDPDPSAIPPEPPRDPRLEIPESLRTPIRKPDYDPVYGDKASRPKTDDLSNVGRGWAIALDFVFTILAGAGLGWLIDRWRHSLPLWTMVGLGLGFVTAFIRIVRATQREELKERQRRGK
jgi:F0F1-type ATP synthase assembly protein I